MVADENDPTVQMQQLMKALGQKDTPEFKPILEINPTHEIVKKMAALKLVEGVPLKNPSEFIKRVNRLTALAL